ncbi:MAG TPA: hypothetical protein VFF69_07285 [Phycisphaerales bacterium]|nr:hypothetical protein [Phycisphaerales bacterium]
MKRVPALCLVSGAIFGLSTMVACEEAYDDGTVDTPTTTDTTPPVQDTTEDYTDTTTTTDVPPPSQPEQDAQQSSYTGTLTRTTDETGAERWMLTGTAEGDLEVDVSAVQEDATALEGMRVVVTGQVAESTDAQGEMINTVTAETIERAE